jgi:O-methyltransferase
MIIDSLKRSNTNKAPEQHLDIQKGEFYELYRLCKPYTMTSVERMYGLYSAVEYILRNNIEGDFVECGVWRGGSSMLILKMLLNRNIRNRRLYMYDTYEGMSEPTSHDVDISKKNASTSLKENESNKEESVWCLASLEDVKRNFAQEGLSIENINFIKGKVEDTIPQVMPTSAIALLRLDTDWYESTKHEMNFLFPKLTRNGVLIIDDYGHWEGCRKAVDEYLADNHISLLLNRMDYTGRMAIKTNL